MKLNILVIEDTLANQEAAKNQLSEHNLTLVSTFEATVEMMETQHFDVVLTDVMLPGEAQGVAGSNPEVGKDTPYGLVIAHMASAKGIPVRMVTDLGHHSNPIAWSLDQLLDLEGPVSCLYSPSPKNWSKALENVRPYIKESGIQESQGENRQVSTVCFARFPQPNGIESKFPDDTLFVSEDDKLVSVLVDAQPDNLCFIGELCETKHDVSELYRKALGVLPNLKRIVVSGFLPQERAFGYLEKQGIPVDQRLEYTVLPELPSWES
jgi:CheY-like chemotaxis protein